MATELWAIGLVLIMTFTNAFGAFFLKKGATHFTFNILKLITNYNLLLGVFLYVVSAILFVPAYKGGDISVLYPLVALSYIWVSFIAILFLNEHMTRTKWAGVFLIILGVALIGMGS